MSTESQRYSLENQETALRQYALKNHFEITKSYVDAGRSGLVLKSRHGLVQLLRMSLTVLTNTKRFLFMT
jgi:DNA invertase Pin-like site-specific DNA recombinase